MRLTILVFGLLLMVPLEVESAQKPSKSKVTSKIPEFVEADYVADIPDELKSSLLDVERRRRTWFDSTTFYLAESEKRLRMAQKGRIDPSQNVISSDSRTGAYTFGNKSQKAAEIESIKKRLKELEDTVRRTATNPLTVPSFKQKIRKGDIGVVREGMKLRQVVNANTILAEAWIAEQNETILITGIDSSGLADDAAFTFSSPLRVMGTKSYTNVLGAKRTVFELAPFDIEKYVTNGDKSKPNPDDKAREPQQK